MSTDEDSLMHRLESEVRRAENGFPEAWRPSELGEMLVGELIDLEEGVETQYGAVDVAEIADEETGEVMAVWLNHAVLKEEWEDAAPAIGDRVGLAYLGQRSPENGGSSYHAYAVEVEHQTSEETSEAEEDHSDSDDAEDEAEAKASEEQQALS